MLKTFLTELKQIRGSKEKFRLLQSTLLELPILEEVLKVCFDYNCVWGIADKTLDKVEKLALKENLFNTNTPNSIQIFLSLCKKKKILQSDLLEFASKISYDDWFFYKHVLAKDLRAGVGIGTIKKLIPSLPQFLTQAANKDLSVIDFSKNRYLVEPKLDGVRCIAIIENSNNIRLFSRNGKIITNFSNIENSLLSVYGVDADKNGGIVIDGELLTNKNNFRQLMQTLYSLEPKSEIIESTTYNSFDYLTLSEFNQQSCNVPLSERKKFLREAEFVNVVETTEVSGKKEIDDLFVAYVRDGYEGIMIKNLHSPYSFKRNDNWIKVKPSDEYTFIITAVKEGNGKYTGMLGSLCGVYVEDSSITVDCGSGLDDSERIHLWKKREELIGTKFDIASDGILETGSLRFPVFVRLREDL